MLRHLGMSANNVYLKSVYPIENLVNVSPAYITQIIPKTPHQKVVMLKGGIGPFVGEQNGTGL